MGTRRAPSYGIELRTTHHRRVGHDHFRIARGRPAQHACYLLIATGVVDDPAIPASTNNGRSIFHCPGRRWARSAPGAFGAGTSVAKLALT